MESAGAVTLMKTGRRTLAYLAESNGQIAYATVSVPQIQANDQFTDSVPCALGQRADKLERVPFD